MRLTNWLQSIAVISLSMGAAHAQTITTASASQPGTPSVQTTYASAQQVNTGSSNAVYSAAATYATYQGDVSQVRTHALSSQSDIEQKLSALGGHNASKFTSGWMSYSALVAAQNREFANSVREIESYYGRERFLNGLRKSPAYATSLKGGDKALQSALAAAESDAMYISSAASFMESQEAILQNQSWVKERIRDGAERANQLKSMTYSGRPVSSSARDMFASSNIGEILANAGQSNAWERATRIATSAPISALSSLTQRRYSVNPARTQTANHMASLAAFEIIGAASTSDTGVINAMNDRRAKDCFEFAQLQLNGCVRSQSDHYGLQACMRKHAVSDIGECVGDVAQ
ncbi:hypothetical protein [Hirschia baltica]|uniref:Uncharacterized protein n=1 Tax=Hirschia baltica (strain ATCC 49814 / DSM 5838 / IFAM 1418) TaxID=582402 RepID=C6XI99_HIRBI|nr:hypothetical protein [Hirschia baltica]ACT58925.1 hypothetical protein Hbal_1233 [Hirschia baltica ATCC 49814]